MQTYFKVEATSHAENPVFLARYLSRAHFGATVSIDHHAGTLCIIGRKVSAQAVQFSLEKCGWHLLNNQERKVA